MRGLFLAVLLQTLFFQQAFCQKYSNEFLSIGVGARAHAMGSTLFASVDDVTAGYWNPAGLTRIEGDLQLGAMHAEWLGGVGKYDFIGIAKPIGDSKLTKRALGLTALRFGVDNIPNTLSLYDTDGTINYRNIVSFSAVDYAVLLSYAQSVYTQEVGDLRLGGNVKMVHRTIGPFARSWGFGLDLGAQYRFGSVTFALMARDITNTFNAWKVEFSEKEKEVLELTDNIIPIGALEVTRPQFQIGIAYADEWDKIGVTGEAGMTITTDGRRNTLLQGKNTSFAPSVGLELAYNRILFLRGGVNNFQQVKTGMENDATWTFQPSIGLGVKFYSLKVDYAYTNMNNSVQNSYSHIISLLLDVDFDYFQRAFKSSRK